MNGYKFFAVMPDARKSKSASKQYPMQPSLARKLHPALFRYLDQP